MSSLIVEEFGLVVVRAPSMDKEWATYAVHPTHFQLEWFEALRAVATNNKRKGEWMKRILGYPDQARLVSGKVRL